MANALKPITSEELEILEQVERKALWLSTYMIHYANKVRPNPDQIKVGGHQASTSSVVSLLTALMCRVMTPRDRLALKPHSSPAYHALQTLLGNLEPAKLKEFRQFGGIQSYPSRRKDTDGIHFNTGSVGLGGVNALFGALVQDYANRHFPQTGEPGRYISVMGDAEMEEGTLYEALVEGQNYNLRNLWWIVDLNRQSLDKLLSLNRVRQLYEIFVSMGWEVIVLKYSRSLVRLFERPGGAEIKRWFDDVGNAEYQTLLRLPAEAYREQLLEQVGSRSKQARALIAGFSGEELKKAIMHLAGNDMSMICEAFDRAAGITERPVAILAYTIKGYGLPLAGHKDNHSGLLNNAEVAALQETYGIRTGHEFDPWAGMTRRKEVKRYLASAPLHAGRQETVVTAPSRVAVPVELGLKYKRQVSTQGAFGQIMVELSRQKGLGERIVTTAPDVAISTNLGGWINRVGIYQPESRPDFYEKYELKSPFRWKEAPAGRHIELGIAENNFFSLLSLLGLSSEMNGNLLFPIGTVYDVFLKRGLDMLANGIYSNSRFLLVGTPSGVTLSPEGGAHQSFLTPMLGIGFPDIHYFEPAFAKELEVMMCWGLEQLQDRENGRSLYLRLSTNPVEQPEVLGNSGDAGDASWRRQVIEGGYWLRDYRRTPDYSARRKINLLSTGVMTVQALAASDGLREEGVYANVIQVTSPGRLYDDWRNFITRDPGKGPASPPYLLELIPPGERHPLVSVIDGHPLSLQWLGEALGVPQISLGVTEFGESGDIESLYRRMKIHADDIVNAVGRLIVDGVKGRDAAAALPGALPAHGRL